METLLTLGYSPGELVQATVKVRNEKGWSIPSIPNVTGVTVKGVPGEIENLSASITSSTSVQLTWDDITVISSETGNLQQYNVYEMLPVLGEQFIQSSATSSTDITGLTANSRHTYRVTAVTTGGESSKSHQSLISIITKPEPVM
jgi:fibronectin type 3 domain-containing protein